MPGPRDARGQWAEALAAAYLMARGYTVVTRRYRVPAGEIDLVARDGEVLVFVEVRARRHSRHGHPLATIGPSKRARIVRAAQAYLQQLAPPWPPMRFDVVALEGGDGQGTQDVGVTYTLVADAFDAFGLRHGH